MPGLSRAVELRQQVANLSSRQDELIGADDSYTDEGVFTDEVRTELDRLHERQEGLLADAGRIEQHEETRADLSEGRGTVAGRQDMAGDGLPTEEEQRGEEGPSTEERQQLVSAAFDGYLRFGLSGLKPEYRAAIEGRHTEFGTPINHEARAQSTVVDTAGGYLVPDAVYGGTIVEAMLAFGGMRASRAFVLTTDTGADLPIPTDNDTSNEGAVIGENVADTETELTFGQARLTSHTYTSRQVLVPMELLQDAAFDLGAYITMKLSTRIARVSNRHFSVGDNSGKPEGVVTGATVGKTAASATAFDPDELTDLYHSVDPDYRTGGEWMFNDTSLKAIKLLKDGEGRRLWHSGIATREPDTIEGKPYIVNQHFATAATGTKPIAFGDFSNYWIRDVRGFAIMRLVERYAEKRQVAFIGFSRHDGRLVDAGTNPVKTLQMA